MQSEEQNSQESDNPFGKLAPEQHKSDKKENSSQLEVPVTRSINLNVIRQKRPRLVIDHMILQDFKSYAGTQKIGTFHGNFTSVVGPNGSGKSNLIEAMLFIFGFNASWMRLNKLNQLIHNSNGSTNNSRAAVQVHFKKLQQHEDGSLTELPNFDLYIRRVVNTSSVSKYYLNGRDSTQAEVKDRLKSEGIDLGNNRFLILQGEVEQISQMKQKSGDPDKPGLLEYLQEIIGSSQFIQRIQECNKEYAQAEEQKHEKGQLMKLVQNELKGMSKAKDEAVKYVRKQKRIFQLQNVFNQVMVASASEELKKLKNMLSQLQRARERIVSEERERLKKQAERIKDVKKKRAQMEDIQKQINKFQDLLTKMQVDDKHITQEISFKSEDIVKFQRKVSEADKEMQKIISHCEEIRDKLPKSKEILEQRIAEIDKMKAELSKYDKPHLKQKIKECEVLISQNQLQGNTIQNKLETIKENLSKMKTGKDQLEIKLKEYREKDKMGQKTRNDINRALPIAEKMVRQKKTSLQGLNEKRNNLRNELRQIQNESRQQLNETQAQGNMSNMFKEIMNQGFKGVIGRLGDLGQVSKEFDQIITTCCNRLDNIVCTDLQTAKTVLDFLKKRKLGRATCIIIEKIAQHRNYMSKPFQNLPRAVRLFDVIKFKTEEAKLAFYFAIGNTLFCEDSDLGLEYSMKNDHERKRVISKNKHKGGYIIYQMNGLMVGSAARKGGFDLKGGMKKKGRDETYLKELDIRKKQLSQSMDEVSKSIQKTEGELNGGLKDLEQMKRELTITNEALKQYEEEIKELSEMIARAEGKSSSNSHQMLEKEIIAMQNHQMQLNNKKMKIQVELKKYEEEQKKNQTKEIQELRQKYKERKIETNKLEKQLEKQRAQLESSFKRMQDLKKGKIQNQKTLDRLKKQIDKLKDDQIQLQNKTTNILGKMAALDESLTQCKKQENELKVIMDQDQKQVKESKIRLEKARKDVDNCQDECKKQGQDLKFAQSQLDRIRQNYRQLTVTYQFFNELDEVEKMTLASDRNYMVDEVDGHNNSSMLETSILNSSIDSNQNNTIFHKDAIFKTEPHQNLNEDLLESFIIHRERITAMIGNENAGLKKMEGSNLEVINQFKSKYGNYRERLKEFQAVKQRQQQLKRIIDDLKGQRLSLFRQGFGIINAKLKEVYQHLTRGGDAQLQLIDSLDPFSDGVNFSVRPPKKSWKQVNKLSGGQKTLSSLSLIFALHYYKPTPLYFMDEIDAALDFKNVSIVADYVKKRTKDAQFIIISLRNNMFDLANKLVGVYKTHDKTKTINLEPNKLIKIQQSLQKENQEFNGNQSRVSS